MDIPQTMQTNDFESEESTTEYTPEEWSAEECAWMLLIAERTDARKATETETVSQCA